MSQSRGNLHMNKELLQLNSVYSLKKQYTAMRMECTVYTLYTEKIQSEYNTESTITLLENGLGRKYAGIAERKFIL